MFTQPEADRLVQAAADDLINGRFAQADSRLAEALRADPRHKMALTKQAELALYRKNHEAALALTGAVLASEPNFAPAWHQRAAALWSAGRKTDALQAARQAVDIQPPNTEFRLRLAQFSAWTGRGADTPDVLAPLLRAERHDPVNYAAAISMLGELAIAEGRFDEARPHLDRALALRPGLKVTRMLRGMNQLRLGRFREGWPDYAAREAIPELNAEAAPARSGQAPHGQAPHGQTWRGQAWHGQALAGKTLLVTDDQGHGDSIQFFRYLPLLRYRGAAHITWHTFPALVRLLRDAAPYATVLNGLPEGARFDFHSNSTSLPRWFGTELDSIPVPGPYLRPPPQSKSALKRPTGRRLKVGLVWSGDARHTRDHLRSVPADAFLTLADQPGISFHSLQHAVRPADRPALNARPAIGREVEKAADFADTAVLIADLDLVIAVDTGVAHLAGALGKPVWVVLHVAPDWRWLTKRADSPWYPSVRLFRVTPAEWLERGGSPPDAAWPETPDEAGWGPVLERVATALRAFAAG
jgi:tetratricopeptide (TPR) repeat protein